MSLLFLPYRSSRPLEWRRLSLPCRTGADDVSPHLSGDPFTASIPWVFVTVRYLNHTTAPSTASSPFLSSTLRKPSQETVRPRFNRAATMPSANTCQHHMLAQTFHGVNYDNFHNTATAPTSPSASSTSGSLVSSSTDDPEYITYYSPAATHRAPFSPKTKVAKKAKSDEENDPKISRPPNAWILYRSKKLAELKEANPKLYVSRSATRNKADRGLRPTQASISKQIASMWAAEPADVKDAYHQEASVRSMVHAIENPGKPQYVISVVL